MKILIQISVSYYYQSDAKSCMLHVYADFGWIRIQAETREQTEKLRSQIDRDKCLKNRDLSITGQRRLPNSSVLREWVIVRGDNNSTSADQYTHRIDHHGPHQPLDEQPNPRPIASADSRAAPSMTPVMTEWTQVSAQLQHSAQKSEIHLQANVLTEKQTTH